MNGPRVCGLLGWAGLGFGGWGAWVWGLGALGSKVSVMRAWRSWLRVWDCACRRLVLGRFCPRLQGAMHARRLFVCVMFLFAVSDRQFGMAGQRFGHSTQFPMCPGLVTSNFHTPVSERMPSCRFYVGLFHRYCSGVLNFPDAPVGLF